jgi:hypothetical protein
MVTKIIDFVKSTAFVLGYLFAVATAYYLSFWGYFDIDAFQFISVEDIIKGIAFPLRYADVGILGIIVFFLIVYTMVALSKFDKPTKRFLIGLLLFHVAPAALVLYYFKYSNASLLAGLAITGLLTMLIIVIYLIADDAHGESKKKVVDAKKTFTDKHPSIEFRNFIVPFALIFFPINAIIAGQVNARDIFDGKKYNYMLHQDLPKDKINMRYDYLIFLGAVSEKYIFINSNESERFIIDKSELPVLRIHHFDASNKETVNHLSEKLVAQFQAGKQEAEEKLAEKRKAKKKETEEKVAEKKEAKKQ